jgi:hypothetical protein
MKLPLLVVLPFAGVGGEVGDGEVEVAEGAVAKGGQRRGESEEKRGTYSFGLKRSWSKTVRRILRSKAC